MKKILHTTLIEFLTENLGTQPFKIPEKIESFYDISGDFSNVKNWKSKVIVGNSLSEGKKIGEWDGVGYVLISLTTNYIIPVSHSDEHQNGYELLSYLIEKYKIKNLSYQSVWLLSNHFVYGGKYHNDEVKAILKAYEYGSRGIMIKQMGGTKYMTIEEYVEHNGDFNQAIKTSKEQKKISTNGQKFIDKLIEVLKLFEKYRSDLDLPKAKKSKLEDSIVVASKELNKIITTNDILWDALYDKDKSKFMYKSFCKAIEDFDINMIDNSLFGMNGVKNSIHMLLKKDDKKLEELFWSNENALEQFNAMAQIR